MTWSRLEKWGNERRWDYVHAVLSMDVIHPLYEYIGLPFQEERAGPFMALLREYDRALYSTATETPVPLGDKQGWLLPRLESLFGAPAKDLYAEWLLQILIYGPGDRVPGWTKWYSIFMRCSLREGWWSRLGLQGSNDKMVERDLEDIKARMGDADDLRQDLESQPRSEWDLKIMGQQGMDEESVECGQPFTKLSITARHFLFSVFWERLLRKLPAEELDRLWEHGQLIAPDLKLAPKDIVHPGDLNVDYVRWLSNRASTE